MVISASSFRLVALLLGLCAGWMLAPVRPASAQYFGRNKVQYDDFDFQSVATDHFSVYFYPEEETAARDAARMAERWHRRHAQAFNHELTDRKPLFFYANDADFQQTNIISGPIGQGIGGVTESLKQRVVMPFTGIYRENDHVLGHELVHSFQYDLAFSTDAGINLANTPLWLVEGMAEYLTLGRRDSHTAMWMRDAALRDDLPAIRDLRDTGAYFPYRYGQALLAYVGSKYGDGAVTQLFRTAGRVGVDSAFVYALGITADSLSREWHAAVRNVYLPLAQDRTPPDQVGRRLLDDEEINVAPAVSPDGRYVAFLSSRALFTLDLYIADAETGAIVKKLRSAATDPHFDAIRFMQAAGAWSPDGEQFAMVTFAEGDNEIAVWDVDRETFRRRLSVEGVTAIRNLAWSPDGTTIAFSGLDGGISDLYLLDLESGSVRQLTNDRYADLQPAWSPDGSRLAFTTDRGPGGTQFDSLQFGPERLAILNVGTGAIDILRPFGIGTQYNPQFTPDGRHLLFLADPDGFKDLYRVELATREVRRLTRVQTGISGITALSPAMSAASQSGRTVFSVFSDGRYSIVSLDPSAVQDAPRVTTPVATDTTADGHPRAGILPLAVAPDESLVATSLQDLSGLPALDWTPIPYKPRLTLDYIAPPTLGVSVGGGFGSQLSGSVGFYFSDYLGNHNLSVEAIANGTFRDLGGRVAYVNRANRLNYGAAVAHIPLLYGAAFYDVAEDPATGIVTQRYNEVYRRIFVDQIDALASYPLRTTRRFELQTGLVRYGFDYRVERYYLYAQGFRRDTDALPEPDPLYLSQSALAYVVDFSSFGFTSPVQGGRYRIQAGPVLGTANYARVLVDARRYWRRGLVTVAARGLHVGNYGATAGDVFSSEYLGYAYNPGFVRGYSFRSFDISECPVNEEGTCPVIDRLQGTRIALASAEVRIPVFGTSQFGLFDVRYLPTELALFVDAGLAWTADEAPVFRFDRDTSARVPVFSAGVSTRLNVLGGFVVEVFYAYPFQRPDKGGHLGLQFLPGW
jgi:WD40 repeat protein